MIFWNMYWTDSDFPFQALKYHHLLFQLIIFLCAFYIYATSLFNAFLHASCKQKAKNKPMDQFTKDDVRLVVNFLGQHLRNCFCDKLYVYRNIKSNSWMKIGPNPQHHSWFDQGTTVYMLSCWSWFQNNINIFVAFFKRIFGVSLWS